MMMRVMLVLIVLAFLLLASTIPMKSVDAGVDGGRGFSRWIMVYAPAVSRSGGGVLIRINLTITYPGTGKLYFSASPLVELDTQATARIAAYVASRVAGVDYYSYNYYVDMTSNSLIVGGPSAGGLMTAGFIALFLNTTLKPNITMTGMINPDGSIGPVGGLLDKLHAAAENGYKYFLIPLGQRIVTVQERVVHHYPFGVFETINLVPVDLVAEGLKLGVVVVEVGNIYEAVQYLLGLNIQLATRSIWMSIKLKDKITNLTLKNLETIKTIRDEASSIYENMGILEKLAARQYIASINDEYNTLKTLIDNDHYGAGLGYSYDALRRVYYDYLVIRYISGENNYTLTSLITNALKELYGRINNTRLPVENTTIKLLIMKNYILSQIQYREGLKYSQSGDLETAIKYYSEALSRAYIADQYLELVNYTCEKLVLDPRIVYTYYDLADAMISYAYTLQEDLGTNNPLLDSAQEYYNYAYEALTNRNILASLGLVIDSLIYSDLAVETGFINNRTVLENISNYLLTLDKQYEPVSNESPMIILYAVARDSLQAENYELSITYSLSYIYLMNLANTNISKPNITITNNNAPIPTTPSGYNKTIPKQYNPYNNPATQSLIIGLIAGFATGFILAWILKKKKTTRPQELIWPV